MSWCATILNRMIEYWPSKEHGTKQKDAIIRSIEAIQQEQQLMKQNRVGNFQYEISVQNINRLNNRRRIKKYHSCFSPQAR